MEGDIGRGMVIMVRVSSSRCDIEYIRRVEEI